MSRVGVVVKTFDGKARIATSQRGVCEACSDRGSCAMDSAPGGGPTEDIVVDNPVGARPGDQVAFDLPGHSELWVSILVWGVPLVGLIAGAVGGSVFAPALGVAQDPAVFTGALLGFGLAFGLVKLVDRYGADDARLVPCILKVVRSCDETEAVRGEFG